MVAMTDLAQAMSSRLQRTESLASLVRSWPLDRRQQWYASLTKQEVLDLAHDWRFWARPKQLPPEWPWTIWLQCMGRGAGKTATGSNWMNAQSNRCGVGARAFLAGPTLADVRDTMIEGESGLIATAHPRNRPVYKPSRRLVQWPSGLKAWTYSSEKPERARGPQHHFGWADEIAVWQSSWKFWSNLMFGLRLKRADGRKAQCVATTTPMPTQLLRFLFKHDGSKAPGTPGLHVHVDTGTTYENLENLDPDFRQSILSAYEGTRLGRQELMGELLTDTPGALWSLTTFDKPNFRVGEKTLPDLQRVAIGVDPAASSGENAAHTGIIAAGRGSDGHGYVLSDYSVRGTPLQWANAAIKAYEDEDADVVVAEVNNGGDMVISTLRNIAPRLPVIAVHASRGKYTRAEPIAALYEQGLVHHLGMLPELEDEMTTWSADGKSKSPDRLDAAVWALTHVMQPYKKRHAIGGAAVAAASPRRIRDADD